jgi:hypothetical protein
MCSSLGLWPLKVASAMGAPGLDFETWEDLATHIRNCAVRDLGAIVPPSAAIRLGQLLRFCYTIRQWGGFFQAGFFWNPPGLDCIQL